MASPPPDAPAAPDGASAAALVSAVWSDMRAEGVHLTIDQLEWGWRIAAFAEARGPGRADLRRLDGMLSGVFAKNEADRLLLRRLLTQHAGPSREPLAEIVTPGGADKPKRRFTRLHVAVAAGVLALVLAGGWLARDWLWPPPAVPPVTGTATLPTVQEAPAQASMSLRSDQIQLEVTPSAPPPWWRAAFAALLALPFALLGLVLAWRRASTPAWARLPPDDQEVLLERDLPQPKAPALFAGPALRGVARSLRRRSGERTLDLDVTATATATAQAAGFFTPVFAERRGGRALHVAIERQSREDHLAQLYARAAAVLHDLGARVRVFNFRRDPRQLSEEDGRPVSAEDAFTQDGAPALLVVGDAGSFLHPLTGAVDTERSGPLHAWQRRFLLSTLRVRAWGRREETVVQDGMSVAPATAAGFTALGEQLEMESITPKLLVVRKRDAA